MAEVNTQPLGQQDSPPTNIVRVLVASIVGIAVFIGGLILFALLHLAIVWLVLCFATVAVIIFCVMVRAKKTQTNAIESFVRANSLSSIEPSSLMVTVPDNMKSKIVENTISDAYTMDFNGHSIKLFVFQNPMHMLDAPTATTAGFAIFDLQQAMTVESVKTHLAQPERYKFILTDGSTVKLIVSGTTFYIKSNMDALLNDLTSLFNATDSN